MNDDTIYRRAAIDALIERDPNCGVDSAEVIKGLPSAQPYTADIQKIQDLEQAEIEKAFELGREDALSEIVRCKECKYMGIGNYCVYGTRLAWLTTNNDFCSRAERREE